MTLEAPDGWEERVRSSFARQRAMATLGASITTLEPGHVELTMPYRAELTQQHGFLHAGTTATLADSACGYAAYSLAPPGFTVLTIEFKTNLLAPARGHTFVADGRVLRAGRTVTVCTATVTATDDVGDGTLIAQMQATLMLFAGEDAPPS